MYFYPRSPCGERPSTPDICAGRIGFLSTLSLRRATENGQAATEQLPAFLSTLSLRRATTVTWDVVNDTDISIHALLAESDLQLLPPSSRPAPFLSTLSLRRATTPRLSRVVPTPIFLSTLSLRRATSKNAAMGNPTLISIHALLAESDAVPDLGKRDVRISIHALLAESDRAPFVALYTSTRISIHALLAESDR